VAAGKLVLYIQIKINRRKTEPGLDNLTYPFRTLYDSRAV